jgi:hypothetical protein
MLMVVGNTTLIWAGDCESRVPGHAADVDGVWRLGMLLSLVRSVYY